MNYSKDANIVRGMGIVTACFGASSLIARPLPLLGFLTLGKALTACVTTGIGCGMVYYRTRVQSEWTVQPPPHSYKASSGYGIKNYFLKPFIWTLPFASIAMIVTTQ
jgi:hypothetical protein